MGCGSSAEQTKIEEPPKRNEGSINKNNYNSHKQDTSGIHKQVTTSNHPVQIGVTSLVGEEKDSYKRKYKAVQKIGSGSYGKVYKVEHLVTKQIRAMKLIKKESITFQDDEQKFLKEIEILTQLDHPHIIKIFEYYQDENHFYVVTELCEGGELFEQIVKNQSFTEYEASGIMKQLLSAVFYMHSKGIVHRDLKPENVLLEGGTDREYVIKIIDFGTSNYYSKNNFNLKIGTPYYIAPEVIKENYNYKCDLWSCGVILYILLSGTAPFDGKSDDEIMNNVSKGHFDFEDDIWEGVSEDAKDLIVKLLTYDPDKRINAGDACSHPFITKFSKYEKGTTNAKALKLENLRNFASKQKFQQVTMAYLVHQVSSTDMMKDLRKIFKEFDKNGDGQLTYEELYQGFKRHFKNDNWVDKEFDIYIKSFDLDNNKIIEYEEFLRVMVSPEKLLNLNNLKMAFEFFDKDHSGHISRSEVFLALGLREDNPEHEQTVAEIFQQFDMNKDGEISFEEFTELMNLFSQKQIK